VTLPAMIASRMTRAMRIINDVRGINRVGAGAISKL
jgi:hypothetical protein